MAVSEFSKRDVMCPISFHVRYLRGKLKGDAFTWNDFWARGTVLAKDLGEINTKQQIKNTCQELIEPLNLLLLRSQH